MERLALNEVLQQHEDVTVPRPAACVIVQGGGGGVGHPVHLLPPRLLHTNHREKLLTSYRRTDFKCRTELEDHMRGLFPFGGGGIVGAL